MFPYSNIKSPRGYAAEAEAAAEAPRNELNRPLPYPRLFKFRTVSANSDHAGDDEEGDSGSGSGSNSNSNSAMADVAHLSFFLLLSISSLISVAGLEFHVGGPRGWVVPAAVDDPEYYNRWAMRERFHVGDSLYFKYKNDSVVVVDREACGKCSAADPLVFFDNGNTTFRFDRYGFFYFISGSQGHCEAGQRLIVRVMVHPATSGVSGSPVPAPATGGSSSSRSGSDSGFDSGPAKSGSPLAIHAGLGMVMGTLLTAALLI